LQTETTKYIIIGISAGIVMFLFMGVIILSFILQYQSKQKKHLEELLLAKVQFEKQLLRSQIEIQEQTFSNISQEIHDNVGQILSLAKVQLNIMNESDHMDRNILNEAKENIRKAMSDLRDIAKSLNSERIISVSLYTTVSSEIERINKSGCISAFLSAEGKERNMNDQKKLILFRIIQESLQNILKHSSASSMFVSFDYLPETLQVKIRDNGKGFDVEEAFKNNNGLGLLNIRTRVSITRGTMSVSSTINEGTIIQLNIPYE